jgi:hypothetical protein
VSVGFDWVKVGKKWRRAKTERGFYLLDISSFEYDVAK